MPSPMHLETHGVAACGARGCSLGTDGVAACGAWACRLWCMGLQPRLSVSSALEPGAHERDRHEQQRPSPYPVHEGPAPLSSVLATWVIPSESTTCSKYSRS